MICPLKIKTLTQDMGTFCKSDQVISPIFLGAGPVDEAMGHIIFALGIHVNEYCVSGTDWVWLPITVNISYD